MPNDKINITYTEVSHLVFENVTDWPDMEAEPGRMFTPESIAVQYIWRSQTDGFPFHWPTWPHITVTGPRVNSDDLASISKTATVVLWDDERAPREVHEFIKVHRPTHLSLVDTREDDSK